MKNKLIKVIVFLFTIWNVLFSTMQVFAEEQIKTVGEAQSFIDGIVDYKMKQAGATSVQQWIDVALCEQAGTDAEWYVIGLSQYDKYDFSAYEKALKSYLSDNEVYSASSRQKYALALIAAGSSDFYIDTVMQNSIGQQGVMSWIYGLHLLNNGYRSNAYTLNAVKETLLSLQLTDGGWAVMGTNGDVDVTAMAVQALASYYYQESQVKTAINRALDFLSEHQLSTGDYVSYGVGNPESTAQVLVALSSLGIDCKNDKRFIKDGNTLFDGIGNYQLSDGSFCHKQGDGFNENATTQVFCAMVAYGRMLNNKTPFYILDVKNSEEESTTMTPSIENMEGAETTVQIAVKETPECLNNYKWWVSLIILLIAGSSSAILFWKKNRNKKDFILIVAIAIIAIIVVWVTDFQTPESYYNQGTMTKENVIGTVTLTIRCDTIVGKDNYEWIPEDGIILTVEEYEIASGETVYDILKEATTKHKIHIETNGVAEGMYVEGIHHIYEFAYGELSGWLYYVNDESTSVGCGAYELKDGDKIEWLYSCAMGEDIK